VILGGTRQLLGAGHWWPRKAPLSVHIGAPITVPQQLEPFAAAVQMRNQAHRVIALGLATTQA